jgi:hypothetical protein
MARTVRMFLMTACLLWAVEAEAITGNQWRELTRAEQAYYIIGVLDGWDDLGDTTLQAKERTPVVTGFTKLVKCAVGMAYAQIHAIIQKYMENNPAKWHSSMALLVWFALNEGCAPTGK